MHKLPFQRLTNQQFYVTTSKGINKDIDVINHSLFPSDILKSFFRGIHELNQAKRKDNDDDIPQLNSNYLDIESFNFTKKKK